MKVGQGHASPVVVDGRVFQFSRQGRREVVRGIDLAAGEELWKSEYSAPYKIEPVARDHGAGPKATPVVVGKRLVTFGISGIVSCWNTSTGKRLWSHEFSQQHRLTSPLYGHAASPIVVGTRVILHVGGHDDGALLGIDVESGRIDWKWTDDGPAYASPVLVAVGGRKHVVTQSQKFHLGVDPASGDILWKVPFTTQYDQNSVTPLAIGNRVLLGGYNQPTVLMSLESRGQALRARKTWSSRETAMYMSSPVRVGKHVYGMTQRRRGALFCLDEDSGKVAWMTPGRLAENAALIAAGRTLFVLTTDGLLRIVAGDPASYQELARYKVSDTPTWAHPALVGATLLVKNAEHLLAYHLGG